MLIYSVDLDGTLLGLCRSLRITCRAGGGFHHRERRIPPSLLAASHYEVLRRWAVRL